MRQGGVSSGIFFAVYIDKLLSILRSSELGCHINMVFLGAMVFADDIILLSASRGGLQSMINLCQNFVQQRNLKFGTHPDPVKSKTKCIIFSKRIRAGQQPANIRLNGNILPWVDRVKHLGHTLQSDNSMKIDMAQKRGAFIGKVNSLLQEFHFVSPEVFMKLLNTYAASMYGSNTWDILSSDCERLYKSFNVTVRNVFSLDRCTHRYLVEPIAGCLHLKVMLASRYVTFFNSLVKSKKMPVRFLARMAQSDLRTVLGKTLSSLQTSCGLTPDQSSQLTANLVKKMLSYYATPDTEAWRVDMSMELLKLRKGELEVPGFSSAEHEEIFKHICVS